MKRSKLSEEQIVYAIHKAALGVVKMSVEIS